MFVTHHLPAISWSALMAVLLLTPGDGGPQVPVLAPVGWLFGLSSYWVDIAGHLVCFAVLGWLLGRSMRAVGVDRATWVAIALASIYGAALEIGQIPIPGRGFEALDLVTNVAGATLGAWMQGLRRRTKVQ